MALASSYKRTSLQEKCAQAVGTLNRISWGCLSKFERPLGDAVRLFIETAAARPLFRTEAMENLRRCVEEFDQERQVLLCAALADKGKTRCSFDHCKRAVEIATSVLVYRQRTNGKRCIDSLVVACDECRQLYFGDQGLSWRISDEDYVYKIEMRGGVLKHHGHQTGEWQPLPAKLVIHRPRYFPTEWDGIPPKLYLSESKLGNQWEVTLSWQGWLGTERVDEPAKNGARCSWVGVTQTVCLYLEGGPPAMSAEAEMSTISTTTVSPTIATSTEPPRKPAAAEQRQTPRQIVRGQVWGDRIGTDNSAGGMTSAADTFRQMRDQYGPLEQGGGGAGPRKFRRG